MLVFYSPSPGVLISTGNRQDRNLWSIRQKIGKKVEATAGRIVVIIYTVVPSSSPFTTKSDLSFASS